MFPNPYFIGINILQTPLVDIDNINRCFSIFFKQCPRYCNQYFSKYLSIFSRGPKSLQIVWAWNSCHHHIVHVRYSGSGSHVDMTYYACDAWCNTKMHHWSVMQGGKMLCTGDLYQSLHPPLFLTIISCWRFKNLNASSGEGRWGRLIIKLSIGFFLIIR